MAKRSQHHHETFGTYVMATDHRSRLLISAKLGEN